MCFERKALKKAICLKNTLSVTLTSPVDSTTYREAMSHVAGAVHIVATQGEAGLAGFTATAFASVSDNPPTVLVCVNRAGRSASLLRANGGFSVNTLAAPDRDLADIFAGRTVLQGENRFQKGLWHCSPAHHPMLGSALVSVSCTLTDIREISTHDVVIGLVNTILFGADQPALVYQGRHYHVL
jgi:flavin reductase